MAINIKTFQSQDTNDFLLSRLTEKNKNEVFIPANTFRSKLFLCGASLNLKESLRYKIDEIFKYYFHYRFRYEIIYPEDIFDELLSGPNKQDLLSLENLLAESVDAVIIIPESSGSFAELGAFASNENLRKKIICLQDQKRKKEKSFINYGPIRLLKKKKQGKVISLKYENISNLTLSLTTFTEINNHSEIKKIRAAITEIEKSTAQKKQSINLLDAENFLIPCIYLLESVGKKTLIKLFQFASNQNKVDADAAISAATNVLLRKKYILKTSEGFKLSISGLGIFKNWSSSSRTNYSYDFNELDSIRVDILTWRERSKTNQLFVV